MSGRRGRGRPRKDDQLMDGAIRHFGPMGYAEADIRSTVQQLIQMHGKTGMWLLKEDDYRVVQDALSEKKQEQEEQPQPRLVQPNKGKSKKLFQRASPMKLVRLYPSMSSDQIGLIKQSDFGGLVDIKCSKLQPELCKFLMESFNPATCELVFPGRGSIPVTEGSVYTVLGVPWGDKDVRYELDADAITFMMEQFGHGGRKRLLMSSLEKKLLEMKKADNKFLRFWVAYAVCSVLAPTTGIQVSPRCYPSLVNIKEVKNLNFCKFVIRMLCKAAESRAEKGITKACMLFFMVKYLDSLELKDMEINSEGTRVTVWTNKMVMKAISQDLRSDGTFGMAPLKAEFANAQTEFANAETMDTNDDTEFANAETIDTNDETEFANTDGGSENADIAHEEETPTDGQSILFSDPDKIGLFIKMNTPADCKSEDTTIFREAVEEACLGFEAGLKNMLKKLTLRPVEKKLRTKRKSRHSVAKKRNPKQKRNQEEQLSPIPTAEKPESNKTSDSDYIVEGEEQVQTESNVSLEDDSVDLGGSCSYRASSSQDGHEPDGGLIPHRRKQAKPGTAAMHEDSRTVTFRDHENTKQHPCEPIMIKSTSPSSEHTRCGQTSVREAVLASPSSDEIYSQDPCTRKDDTAAAVKDVYDMVKATATSAVEQAQQDKATHDTGKQLQPLHEEETKQKEAARSEAAGERDMPDVEVHNEISAEAELAVEGAVEAPVESDMPNVEVHNEISAEAELAVEGADPMLIDLPAPEATLPRPAATGTNCARLPCYGWISEPESDSDYEEYLASRQREVPAPVPGGYACSVRGSG